MTDPRPALENGVLQRLLTVLGELAPALRAAAPEADRLARLPGSIAATLARHGLFRLWVPKRISGFELTLPEALEVYEAAARVDGSVGWAVMIGWRRSVRGL